MPSEKAERLPCGRIGDCQHSPKGRLHVTDTCQGRGKAEPRVQLQSAMSQLDRLGQPFAGRWVKIWHGAETKIIGGEVFRSPPRRYRSFCLKQFWPNG